MQSRTQPVPELTDLSGKALKGGWKARYELALQIEEENDGSDWAIMTLLKLLEDPSGQVRWRATEALWQIGGALPRIGCRSVMHDPESMVRNAATEALGEIGTVYDIVLLIEALQDKQWVVRASAASSLGTIVEEMSETVKKRLSEVLCQDRSRHVKRYAAVALGKSNDPTIIALLTDRLAKEIAPEVRSGILMGLYELGQRNRIEDMVDLLFTGNPEVQAQVLQNAPFLRPEDFPIMAESIRGFLERQLPAHLHSSAQDALKQIVKPGDDVDPDYP